MSAIGVKELSYLQKLHDLIVFEKIGKYFVLFCELFLQVWKGNFILCTKAR